MGDENVPPSNVRGGAAHKPPGPPSPDPDSNSSLFSSFMNSTTSRARLGKFALLTTIIFTVVFVTNAAIVGISMYSVSDMGPDDLKLEKVSLNDLCDDAASLELKGSVKRRGALDFFLLSTTRTAVIKVSFPEAKDSNGRTLPYFLSIEIPPFLFGRGHLKFDFTGSNAIKISPNREFKLKHLAEYLLSNESKKIAFEVDGALETSSFWIPLSFDRKDKFEFVIDPKKDFSGSQFSEETLSVETIELLDHADPNNLEIKVNVRLPDCYIPKFLHVDVPAVGLEIGYKKLAVSHEKIFPVASVTLDSFILSHFSSDFMFRISLNRTHKDALLDLLRKVKSGADNVELAIRGMAFARNDICEADGECHICGFQRLLNTLEVSKPFAELIDMVPLNKNSTALSTRILESPEIMSVGLIGVQQTDLVPRFNFEVGISKDFVSKAINYDIRKIRGKLPPLALKNILESSHANATLAKLDIEHLGDDEDDAHINFSVSISFIDAFEASKFAAHLAFMGIESPAQMMDEIGDYQRLYFKGIEDTLLSSIASIYEIDLPLSRKPEKETSHFGGFNVPGYVFSAPSDGASLIASHSIAASLSQNERRAELSVVCKLNKEPLVKNPIVRFYWGELDVTFFSEVEKSQVPLAAMTLSRGQFHLSLSPNNPLHLIHNGIIQTSIHTNVPTASTTLQLLDAWKALLYKIANSSEYTNVQAVALLSGKSAKIELAVPPYSVIESSKNNQFGGSSKFVKKSQLRVVGLRGSTIQALLKLPAMNICPISQQSISSIVSFEMTIPRVEANLCSSKENANYNLMKVGIYPMKISGSVVDRSFCDLKIEMHYQNHDQDTFVSQEQASDMRSNWIPLSATIVDFEKLLEVFDETAAETNSFCLTTCKESEMEKGIPLLNMIIDYAGSSFKFKAPSSAPKIEPVSRPVITNFMSEKPVKLEFRANSPNRHQLEGSFMMVIPEECLPRRSTDKTPTDNEEGSMMALQWGAVSIEIQDGRNIFKVNVSQGQVEIRLDEGSVRLGHRSNGLYGEFTNSFEAKFQVSLENKDFNSADIRRFIHNIYSYGQGEKSSFVTEKNIGSRTVLMKASMQRFVCQADANKANNNVVNSVVSSLHFKTLVSLMKAMARRAGSRPSHLDDLWSLWRSEVELLKPPQARKVDFPCLLPSMCGNGLLYESSIMQPLFPMKIVVSHFVQLMCESAALGIGRLLSKLDLASHPRKLQLSMITESDSFVASSLNDIDILEAHVRADQMAISRVATIIYPDEITEGSEVLVQQVRDIMEDRFTVVLDLSLAKYYHDISGLIHHISIDPLFRMALDPIPKYTKLYESGEDPAPLYQSPLNSYPSTERIAKSNLLSTLSCILIAEMPMGSIVSALGSATLNVSSCLGVNGKPSSSVTTLLEVDGMSFPNPSARVNLKISRPLIGTYLYKRDEPLPTDPVDGFHIASGRVEPIAGESYPLIFEASTYHPILLYGSLSYVVDGLNPENPDDRAIIQKFASRAALGKEMQTIMELDLVDDLMIRMKLDFPPRDFDLSFFDAEHSSPDARSINKVTQGIYEMGKKVSNAVGTVKEKWGNFRNWIWGSIPEPDGPPPTEESESKPGRSPVANPETGGQGYTDFNFALSLRNPADFTMAVNTLKIGITIDDNDGLIQGFPVSVTDKKIHGTLLLAQHKCHPSKTPSAQTLEEFLRCAHANPSRELFPNEHLLDNSRLLAPVAFEKRVHYLQAVDEIVNHDGLCLEIDGTFSLGILDNGDGRFPLDFPVEVKRVPIPRVSFAQKPITEESKKNIKYQVDFDPCFKLKKNSEIGNIHEIFGRKQLWYSLAHDLITTVSASSPIMIAGRSTKSHVASLMLNEQISLESSVLYEFTFEFKASVIFSTYPGFAFVWHANEKNSVVGSGEYGYAGIEKSVALAIHPYRFNSIKLLHDGELANVLYEKRGAVFPKKYYDRKMHVSLRYLSFDRRFILDVHGDGDDFIYHSVINIEREPDDSPITRGPSLASMVGSPTGWFGITANSTGALDIIVSSFKINAIEPKLEKTKVYWPSPLSALPGQEGHFVIRLTDHADFAMAKANGNLRIKLRCINSHHPRSVIEIPDEKTPTKQRNDKASLLQFPPAVETECSMRYRLALGLYDVFYKAPLPGRYAILMSYEDGPWTKVQWSTIYIRHVW